MSLLQIKELAVTFGQFRAVDDVDLTLDSGQVLGIVGESGSGKSVSMLALMGLIRYPGLISSTKLHFNGIDMGRIQPKQRRHIIGKEIAMIFQEPMTSLNPCFTVGYQIMETLKQHQGGDRKLRRHRTIELLSQVGIPDAERRLSAYPHQFSGGMSQRVMIAMAIACNPKLLIADEPTTALDVTIQAQILDLLLNLQRERGMSLVLITHDMAVVSEIAHKIAVMYAGQIVEQQSTADLFAHPDHPYTHALLSALPERNPTRKRLPTISGVVPGQYDRPRGCLFHPRCQFAQPRCHDQPPQLTDGNRGRIRCHFPISATDGDQN